MKISDFGPLLPVCLCGALLAGCAGGGSSATRAPGPIPAASQSAPQLPGGAVRRPQSAPQCSGTGLDSFVGGGIGNAAGASISGVLDGQSNFVCDSGSAIADGFENIISSGASTSYYSFIGAGSSNTITGNGYQSVIGSGNANLLSAPNSVIAGGSENSLSGQGFELIGGGTSNTLTGEYGVIAGGLNNNVSGEGAYVAAGGYNTASGEGAVVDGGFKSTAGGAFATIPGGYANYATGVYSFAAGSHASSLENGTFVWSDGSDGDSYLTAHTAYEFLARASGGFTLWTNAAGTVGATLAPGSGTWASASDRNLKTDVARIDDSAVLEKVATLPIERWSYKSEQGVRHVGPMAQDFYAAFKVGEDDKHITSIDEDGVALAAIKALHGRIGVLDAENASLRAQLAILKTSQARHDLLVDRQLERLGVAVAASHNR